MLIIVEAPRLPLLMTDILHGLMYKNSTSYGSV